MSSILYQELLRTALITICYQLFFFFIAAYYKFDKVTDLAGGSNFVINALLVYYFQALPNPTLRQSIATTLVTLWGIRLSSFLLYRVLKFEKDSRFDGLRENFVKFLSFWVLQMIWAWTVPLPLLYLNVNDPNNNQVGTVDKIGIALAVLGLIIETWSDQSKLLFKLSNITQTRWCNWGLWKYSRHPNYFGEIMFWWGIYLIASSSFKHGGSFTIVGPILITTFLLFLSGIPILERTANNNYGSIEAYHKYKLNTSMLIPLPPTLYSNLPQTIKKWFLFEWDYYK